MLKKGIKMQMPRQVKIRSQLNKEVIKQGKSICTRESTIVELKSAMAAVDRKRISFKKAAVYLKGPEFTAYSNSGVFWNIRIDEEPKMRNIWTSR